MDVVARGQPQAISANMTELVIHIFFILAPDGMFPKSYG